MTTCQMDSQIESLSKRLKHEGMVALVASRWALPAVGGGGGRGYERSQAFWLLEVAYCAWYNEG